LDAGISDGAALFPTYLIKLDLNSENIPIEAMAVVSAVLFDPLGYL
jgi:hypothetical protein